MGQALPITRTEHTDEALREFAAKCRDGAQVRCVLAIALILEGRSRTEAADLSGMDRQTLRDWVHRYNAAGIAGLTSRCSSGRPPDASCARVLCGILRTGLIGLIEGSARQTTAVHKTGERHDRRQR